MSDTPRPPLPLGKSPVRLNSPSFTTDENGNPIYDTGAAIRQCKDPMHVFAEVPGHCQCGSEYWESLDSGDIP